ncbi:MAG: NADH-quinone oxidoreductase subunit J, partial [Anaerolineales bacterium]|nr:NADH-quinone oxidoreductase subunit J [Anaerolineales bacterium]
IVFGITAFVMLVAAFMLVTTKNLVHAALWLIVVLFGAAVLFATLNAGFIAVVQVVVYIGAIAILFIFAVMLTRREKSETGAGLNQGWWLSAVISVIAFGGLTWLLRGWDGFSKAAPALPSGFDAIGALSQALVSPEAYVLPFEVASVLLLAALVGAVYIAFQKKGEE